MASLQKVPPGLVICLASKVAADQYTRSDPRKKKERKKTVPVLSVPLLVDRGGLPGQVGGK